MGWNGEMGMGIRRRRMEEDGDGDGIILWCKVHICSSHCYVTEGGGKGWWGVKRMPVVTCPMCGRGDAVWG